MIGGLGLDGEGQAALVRALSTHHRVTASVQLMTTEHEHLGWFKGRLLEGQVNIDAQADITRQTQFTALDPDRTLEIDLNTGAPRINRMVRIRYNVWVEELDIGWVAIPVFTGPVTKVNRTGPTVQVEALGKEYLSSRPARVTRTWSAGLYRDRVIRAIMREIIGERHFDFPQDWPQKLARPLQIKTQSIPWQQAQRLARSMNADLFYDGRGTLRMRRRPTRSAFTFREGLGGTILSEVVSEMDADDIVNTVRVTGATPKGKKTPIHWTEHVPLGDPHSSWDLAINGARQFYFEDVSDDTIRTKEEAKRVAKRRITQARIDNTSVKFDALPIPLLEEKDPITVESLHINRTSRLQQMSLPLGHGGSSSIGYLANIRKRRARP